MLMIFITIGIDRELHKTSGIRTVDRFPGLFGFGSGSFPQTSNPKPTPHVLAPFPNEKAEKAGSNAGTTAALLFIAEVCP